MIRCLIEPATLRRAAMLAVFAAQAALAADALTLADAQREAVARSRLLDAQQSAAAASHELAVAAAQLPDPVATVGLTNVPVSGSDAFSLTRDSMTMRSVGVMQEFTRAEKRRARAERFEPDADRQLAERSASVATIERETALAWLDRYYAEAQSAVIAEQARQARTELEAAEAAYRAGRGGLAEILGARSALVTFDDRASELRRRVAAATIALARYAGDVGDRPLAARPDIDTLRFDARTLESDMPHHPQIAALAQREEVAAAEVRVSQANRKADWSVQLMYGLRGPGYPDMVSLGVSVPLQWDRPQRQDREVAAKLAMLDQARAEREDALRAHRAEVQATLVEWNNDRERSVRYAKELVPLAAERTEATLAAYRGAKASLTDVLLARRNEIDVRMQALQLEAETARAWAQLEFLVPTTASIDRWRNPS